MWWTYDEHNVINACIYVDLIVDCDLDRCWLVLIDDLGQSEVMALTWCNIVATLKERDQLFYGYPVL
jgi:hypothetical protein